MVHGQTNIKTSRKLNPQHNTPYSETRNEHTNN